MVGRPRSTSRISLIMFVLSCGTNKS